MTATPTRPTERDAAVRVGKLDEIANPTVISGGRHGIAVFIADGKPYAVDNRCPHMGFPLHRGSVRDGILTCHWHHARFDLRSGGTFDPWADDVRTYEAWLDGDVVVVDPRPRDDDRRGRWVRRLHDGMEQNLNLLLVKSILALLDDGAPGAEVAAAGVEFGARYRERGWSSGLTILAAMTNMLPQLDREDQVLALYHGLSNVARDCSGQPPRFQLDPLPASDVGVPRLTTWFRSFCEVRDRDGAERALASAAEAGATPVELSHMLLAAATDHLFLDGGHTLDFINKACEALDVVGWDRATDVLPSVIPSITGATRAEELNTWRHPVDLVALLDESLATLPQALQSPRHNATIDLAVAADILLGDDPYAIVAWLMESLRSGTRPTELTRALAYAAVLRVARFHTSNEFSDWITVLHTFTYANALHRSMLRAPSPELARGLFHGAMRVYLDRFLNMPAARLPDERPTADDSPDPSALLSELLELTDREQRVNEAGQLAERYLAAGHDPAELISTLGHVLLREDGEFHSYQMLEAGTQLFHDLQDSEPLAARRSLVAVARYLAAHAPTSRAMYQTARTALRLHRGEAIYESAEEDAAAD